MPITKATLMTWWANFLSGSVIIGGAWMAFFDTHYRGIGAICLVLGVVIQYYFKHKSDKREEEAHHKAMEPGK